MKIHIAAAKEDTADVQRIAQAIKNAGYEVWDWTHDEIPVEYKNEILPEWSYCVPHYSYHRALARDCADADLIVAVGKGDFQAGREVGIAYVLDIPVVSIVDQRSEHGFMDELRNLSGTVSLLKRIYPPSGLLRTREETMEVRGE